VLSEQEIIQQLNKAYPGAITSTQVPAPKTMYITVDSSSISDICRYLFKKGARFVISVATDRIKDTGKLELCHIFSFDDDCLTVTVKTQVDSSNPAVASISATLPAANWAERECHDMLGIEFIGHPDPRRLALADDWPKDVYPLRRDFPYNYKPPPAPENAVQLNTPKAPASVIPVGPFYPVLEEPAYFRVFVDGEEIIGCDYRGFYNHRGIEKLADSALTYNQIVFLAERICGI
jgi:formate hydrogenlyase subunit 5